MKSTRYTFGRRLRQPNDKQISWENLVDLPNERVAFVYQRLSSNEQTRKSIYSIKAQAALEDLAREDGYPDALIHVSDEDLIDAVSGTKGQEQRPGLARLVSMVERDLVESVYVVHISRLYRDQTLINAFALGESLCANMSDTTLLDDLG